MPFLLDGRSKASITAGSGRGASFRRSFFLLRAGGGDGACISSSLLLPVVAVSGDLRLVGDGDGAILSQASDVLARVGN